MKKITLLFALLITISQSNYAQCTISGSTITSTTLNSLPFCTTYAGCTTIYVGDGVNPTSLIMTANFNLTCLGPIQFVIRNNANIDFSTGNYDLTLAANSGIIVENGGNISAASNCSASDLIWIGGVKVASCNGQGGQGIIDFPTLVNNGGYNTVIATASTLCGSGTSTITAQKMPLPTSSTTYKLYSVASGGTPISTIVSTTSPYSANLVTPVVNTTTTFYVEAVTGTLSTPRRTVVVTVIPLPSTPVVSISHPTCAVLTGSININTPLGSGMTYSINNSTFSNTSGLFTNLSPGNYPVAAKNSQGCISPSLSVVVNSQRVNSWNGTSWSLGSSPTNEDRIVFNGSFSSTTDLVGCSVQVNSGNVVINDGNTLNVINNVTVSGGTLTFENNASLIQESPSAVNSGNITYKRKTTPLKQWDFTYWSSPVTNATLSQLATNYDFYSFNPSINNWVYQLGSNSMLPGTGYIGRNGSNPSLSGLITSFGGVPNNGNINAPIIKSTGTLNLIGNPYPSAIDIDIFLTDTANNAIVNGTIFLWTHNTLISGNVYTQDDYAKYNLTGGVRAISGGPIPTGKVAAGQGFFIEANPSLANGNYNATFKNNMRVINNNNQFFRMSNSGNTTSSYSANLERNRFWLSLYNSQGAYNQMLLGYIQDATDEYDTLFDGKTLPSGNTVSIFTLVGAEKLAIQGKALPFSSNDVVPIGYSTTLNGSLSINLDNFDGIFENQEIYLLDKYLNVYHDIKNLPYTFNSSIGTFTNRFEIRYASYTSGITARDLNINNIKIISNYNELTIFSSIENIEEVVIFDILGKMIYQNSNKVGNKEFQSGKLNIVPQIVLVKITLNNGIVISKKVII